MLLYRCLSFKADVYLYATLFYKIQSGISKYRHDKNVVRNILTHLSFQLRIHLSILPASLLYFPPMDPGRTFSFAELSADLAQLDLPRRSPL